MYLFREYPVFDSDSRDMMIMQWGNSEDLVAVSAGWSLSMDGKRRFFGYVEMRMHAISGHS